MVIGSTGSGKTTLARRLSRLLGVPHLELDALNWGPDWTPVPREEFVRRLEAGLAADEWVVDGNYSSTRETVWSLADTIIWLDFGLHIVWPRLARRTVHRIVAQTELWAGNKERWSNVVQRDNLFYWSWRFRQLRRPEYQRILGATDRRWTVIHLRSPRQTRRWLEALEVERLASR